MVWGRSGRTPQAEGTARRKVWGAAGGQGLVGRWHTAEEDFDPAGWCPSTEPLLPRDGPAASPVPGEDDRQPGAPGFGLVTAGETAQPCRPHESELSLPSVPRR